MLKVENLVVSYGPINALKGISLSVERGEIVTLIGPNGSGKSTLASMICGIHKPTSGKMYLNGKEYAPSNPVDANEQHVAMVLQELGVVGPLDPVTNMFLGRTGSATDTVTTRTSAQ